MDKGIIYIVTLSEYHLHESIFSAISVKRHCPNLHITLITDFNINNSCFDRIINVKADIHPLKLKVKYLLKSPYKKTLFLDSDTEIISPIYEIFDYIKENDLAFAHGPKADFSKFPPKFIDFEDREIFNTGVILYNKSENVKKLFNEWFESVKNQDEKNMSPGNNCDQTYFNKLIKNNILEKYNLKIKVFPNKIYNVRPTMLSALKQNNEIINSKILHCHGLNYKNSMPYLQLLYKTLNRQKSKEE